MFRAAICDDESTILDYLHKHIADEFKRQGVDVCINRFTSGKEFLKAHKSEPFDVVFLDIRMPDMDGFDVAAEIRSLSEKTYIIFITTENALVYDSFSFQPFDFIPKTPPSELNSSDSLEFLSQRIANVISRLISRILFAKTICLPLPYNQKIIVNISDIQMVQSVRNYAEYVFANRDPVRVRAKLDDVWQNLNPRVFSRPHKSYIINMNFIENVDSRNSLVKLKNGNLFTISKTCKQDFESSYLNFLSDLGR